MDSQLEPSDPNQVGLLEDEKQENKDVDNPVENMEPEQHHTELNDSESSQQLSKRMQRKLRKREQWLANLPAKR